MPTLFKSENVLDLGADGVVNDTSDERFDRGEFARRAIDLVQPRRTTVAICEGASRLRVESGRLWGQPRAEPDAPDEGEERWALLAIPSDASRRAIAFAVAGLAHGAPAYALDVLINEATGADVAAFRSERSVG